VGISIQAPGPAQESGVVGQSVTAHGSPSTGPAANAIITSIAAASLVAGQAYRVDVYYYLNGTTASPADDDNTRITYNGSNQAAIPWDGTPTSGGPPNLFTFTGGPADGTHAIIVSAIAAATATAIYHATIVATPIGV
jgi:hypothetical protein